VPDAELTWSGGVLRGFAAIPLLFKREDGLRELGEDALTRVGSQGIWNALLP
jgi:hypothetical protein